MGQQQNAKIRALEARVAELEAALAPLVDNDTDDSHCVDTDWADLKLTVGEMRAARAALGRKG